MSEPRPVARPRVFAVGVLVALFGLTLLLALALIGRAEAWWRFLLLVPPLAFGAAAVWEFRRSVKNPDERQ
jgi:hypothetical protein